MSTQTARRICPFCEATCGLKLEVDGREVRSVRGDDEDAFSEGYVCPKGTALDEYDADPDRLRAPLIREGETFREATWDEAFTHIHEHLSPIIAQQGKHAVGVYLGNPTVHNLGLTLYGPAFLKALGSHNIFSATSADQLPKQLVCAALYGTGLSVPIPDIDRTDFLLVLGANPLVSNGSLMTAPNIGERLKRIQARGGRIVVVDPCRTKTAAMADDHLFITPGTDAYLLFAMVHTLMEENLTKPGSLNDLVDGLETIRDLATFYAPEAVAKRCGIDARQIRQLARDLAGAPTAAIHGRIGTCTQEFGTLASWLVEVLHILTGNLDRPGGAMFSKPAFGPGHTKGAGGTGRGVSVGRRNSRVRGRPERFGEFPVACLAEEIDTPGEGQIRALFTVCGNPVVSSPNSARLDTALGSLDYMVSVDVYLNETTRHANVILPGPSPLETSHYDLAFTNFSLRNVARYSPPVFPLSDGMIPDWQVMLRLMGIVAGAGPVADPAFLDGMVLNTLIEREIRIPESPIHNADINDIQRALQDRQGPERILDFMVRTGPYGDGFGKKPDGLSLASLEAAPTGIDLGPLKSRLPEVLRTPSGRIDLATDFIIRDEPRLRGDLDTPDNGLVLIGRRDLRSNNSWFHNLPKLMTGKARCTLHVNPDDAALYALSEGAYARVTSRVGSVEVAVHITDAIVPGVVSLPHGWGHTHSAIRMQTAQANAGVNSNILTDEAVLDEPSGNAVLCGIPVRLEKVG